MVRTDLAGLNQGPGKVSRQDNVQQPVPMQMPQLPATFSKFYPAKTMDMWLDVLYPQCVRFHGFHGNNAGSMQQPGMRQQEGIK